MQGYACRYVISVLLPDRVGILSGITTAVSDLGANIEGISQTVVDGYFTVILIAAFKTAVGVSVVHEAVTRQFQKNEASVLVREYVPPAHNPASGDRYILTMSGIDRPGILKTLTTFLAEKKINVEDLFFRIVGDRVTHIGEVTIPHSLDVKQVQDELRELMATLGLTAGLQHENIFLVTNQVGSIQSMLKGQRHA